MGERLHGMQEVTGSIPVFSTKAKLFELFADRQWVRIYFLYRKKRRQIIE